jgi:sulfite exporter TauE/SafE
MKPNVGSLDRTLRIIAGLALLGAGLYLKSWWALVGLVPLLTAAFRVCPAYLPFGLNTCSIGKK